jgi:Spy/CpxP family protein refolding chaperone
MQKLYEPLAPQAREETRRVRQEIQAILTPQQKKTFNEKFKKRPPAIRTETNVTAQPQK